jgi:NAD(P)-dependent dehydrogenase (short-subunit alcohol dehydrogenase family)
MATTTFGFESTTDEVIAGRDLRQKVAIVTGASSGLGRETARALASAGCHVYLAGRNEEKLASVAAEIAESAPGARCDVAPLDLTSLQQVRCFADDFMAHNEHLHLLINNAGVMNTPLERTAEGFELQFGTNHVGHFLLTCLLVPALLRDAPARIVNLSSGGHMASDIVWDDPNFERRPYDPFSSYGQSKTANILFTVELERRLGDRGVHAYAVHPGLVATELGRYMTPELWAQLKEKAKQGGGMPTRKSLGQGAATTVWAATAPGIEDVGGSYLADCQVSDHYAAWARDPAAAARLWALTEQLVGQQFSFEP